MAVSVARLPEIMVFVMAKSYFSLKMSFLFKVKVFEDAFGDYGGK